MATGNPPEHSHVATVAGLSSLVSLCVAGFVVVGLVLDRWRFQKRIPKTTSLWLMEYLLLVDVASSLRLVIDNFIVFQRDPRSHDSGTETCTIFGWLNLVTSSAHATIGAVFWSLAFFSVMPKIRIPLCKREVVLRGYTGAPGQVFFFRAVALALLAFAIIGSSAALVTSASPPSSSASGPDPLNGSTCVNLNTLIVQSEDGTWCYLQDRAWLWPLVWGWYVVQAFMACCYAFVVMLPPSRRVDIGNEAYDVLMRRFFLCVLMGVASIIIVVASHQPKSVRQSPYAAFASAIIYPLLGFSDAVVFMWSEPWFFGLTWRTLLRQPLEVHALPIGFTSSLTKVSRDKLRRDEPHTDVDSAVGPRQRPVATEASRLI